MRQPAKTIWRGENHPSNDFNLNAPWGWTFPALRAFYYTPRGTQVRNRYSPTNLMQLRRMQIDDTAAAKLFIIAQGLFNPDGNKDNYGNSGTQISLYGPWLDFPEWPIAQGITGEDNPVMVLEKQTDGWLRIETFNRDNWDYSRRTPASHPWLYCLKLPSLARGSLVRGNAIDSRGVSFPLLSRSQAWLPPDSVEYISNFDEFIIQKEVEPVPEPIVPIVIPTPKLSILNTLRELIAKTGWEKVDGSWIYTRPERKFEWPTISKVVTQQFGKRPEVYGQWGLPGHNGLDMRVLSSGTAINAAWDGKVIQIGIDSGGGYGNYVATEGVYEGVKYIFMYAHLQYPSKLRLGDKIRAGRFIGPAGSTGFSSGAHLHFHMRTLEGEYPPVGQEAWPRQYVDPEPFFSHINYKIV